MINNISFNPDKTILHPAPRHGLQLKAFYNRPDVVTFGSEEKKQPETDSAKKEPQTSAESKQNEQSKDKGKNGAANVLYDVAEMGIFMAFPGLILPFLATTAISLIVLSKISGAKYDKKTKEITNRPEVETKLKNFFAGVVLLPLLPLRIIPPFNKLIKKLRERIAQGPCAWCADHTMTRLEKKKKLGFWKWGGLLILGFLESKFLKKFKLIGKLLGWLKWMGVAKNQNTQQAAGRILTSILKTK